MGRLIIPRRIGIMGGMGPLATVDLFRKITELTPADCDQAHIPIIIDSYPQIEDRTAFILGYGEDPSEKMIESANRLKMAGAEIILIACNTAHYFINKVKKEVDVSFIHIVKSTVEAIQFANHSGKNYQNIAVLATDGTNSSRLYQNELEHAGLNVVSLNTEQQKLLMECIYEGAKKGKLIEYQSKFQAIMDSLTADAYIAACTELPLFTECLAKDYVVFDATQLLAEKAVEFALGNSNDKY